MNSLPCSPQKEPTHQHHGPGLPGSVRPSGAAAQAPQCMALGGSSPRRLTQGGRGKTDGGQGEGGERDETCPGSQALSDSSPRRLTQVGRVKTDGGQGEGDGRGMRPAQDPLLVPAGAELWPMSSVPFPQPCRVSLSPAPYPLFFAVQILPVPSLPPHGPQAVRRPRWGQARGHSPAGASQRGSGSQGGRSC